MKKVLILSAITLLMLSCSSQYAPSSTTSTKNVINKNTFKFISNDKKTYFLLLTDDNGDVATLKNLTTGVSYEMKSSMSASGAKYEDKEGNYFWIHQGSFMFGKGDDIAIEGKMLK